MKKGLVTAFVIASVLAFNACKKEEGPVGPKGDKGDAGAPGAPGAQGPIGPQGVKGEDGANGQDGATIRSDEGAPDANLGNVGDYYFDKTDRLLYGPKTEAGWGDAADAVTLYGPQGPAGADGVDGANGSSFTAGAGAPTAADGNEGDFYFDVETSTFYGPKGATDWSTGSVLPLAATSLSTTYYYVAGFNVTDEVVSYGEYIDAVYSDYTQFSSYRINAEDVYRMTNYSNWHINREMMFEQVANNGIFNLVPRGAWDFAIEDPTTPGAYIAAATVPGGETSAMIRAGREFKYTGATEVEANHTYTLTNEDITRLAIADGTAFDYLVYAATKREDLALDKPVTFFQKKTLTKKTHTDHFYAEYDATTVIDFEALVPEFERLKKEGAYIFAGYNFFDEDGVIIDDYTSAGTSRGHILLTDEAIRYFKGGVEYGPNNSYESTANAVSTGHTGAGAAWTTIANNPYIYNHPTFGGAGRFGQTVLNFYTPPVGSVAPFIAQTATPVNVASETYYNDGKLHITWDIVSGLSIPNGGYDVSPLTMTNPAIVGPPAFPNGAPMEGWWENGVWVLRTFETDYYTGSRFDAPSLTLGSGQAATRFFDFARNEYVLVPAATAPDTKHWVSSVNLSHGGLTAAEWEAKKLVRVVINIVDAEAKAKAQAAGIDVNNPEALINFANSLQLQ